MIPLDGTFSLALYYLAGPSASASLGPKNGTLNVDASTLRINNPCLRITGRRSALLLSQSPRGLGPDSSPSRVASIPLDGKWTRTNYKIRHDPPPQAEYPFEYSPPHSPTGVLDPPTANQTPASESPHILPTRTFLRDPSPLSGVPAHRPPPLEAEPVARAQRA
jgi:hypothetical protein